MTSYAMLTKIDASTNEHLESWAQLPGSDLWNVQLAMFKETFKANFNVKEAKSVAVLRDPRPYGAKGHS